VQSYFDLIPLFVLYHAAGAGTANMFSTAVGHPNCCALIELFPDKKLPFYTIRGFGNLARHYGMHYYRYQANEGRTSTTDGTTVDIPHLVALVQSAVLDVQKKPSCLNNASDSTFNILATKNIAERNRI
jgi:hypothetical protein